MSVSQINVCVWGGGVSVWKERERERNLSFTCQMDTLFLGAWARSWLEVEQNWTQTDALMGCCAICDDLHHNVTTLNLKQDTLGRLLYIKLNSNVQFWKEDLEWEVRRNRNKPFFGSDCKSGPTYGCFFIKVWSHSSREHLTNPSCTWLRWCWTEFSLAWLSPPVNLEQMCFNNKGIVLDMERYHTDWVNLSHPTVFWRWKCLGKWKTAFGSLT